MHMIAALAAALAFACAATSAYADCATGTPGGATLRAITQEVNAARSRAGLPAVQTSSRLASAAQRYACQLARTGTFAHRGPDGSDLRTRVSAVGYPACRAAENLALGHDAATVVPAWMDSQGHRRNLLDAELQDLGLGVAVAGGRPYIVLVLGRPCNARA
jgi:uncharacterized protein YkwD